MVDSSVNSSWQEWDIPQTTNQRTEVLIINKDKSLSISKDTSRLNGIASHKGSRLSVEPEPPAESMATVSVDVFLFIS